MKTSKRNIGRAVRIRLHTTGSSISVVFGDKTCLKTSDFPSSGDEGNSPKGLPYFWRVNKALF